MLKRIIQKAFNYAYGFDLNKLNPNNELVVYYYHTFGVKPTYGTDGSVGADVVADLGVEDSIIIKPGEKVKIPTGLFIEQPKGFAALLYSRSGLSSKGLVLTNGVGVIDYDYRGQIHFPVLNVSNEDIMISDGERIGQLLLMETKKVEFIEVNSPEDLTETKRGCGGFGSTGRK